MKIGDIEITNPRIGDLDINKVMYGDTQVWVREVVPSYYPVDIRVFPKAGVYKEGQIRINIEGGVNMEYQKDGTSTWTPILNSINTNIASLGLWTQVRGDSVTGIYFDSVYSIEKIHVNNLTGVTDLSQFLRGQSYLTEFILSSPQVTQNVTNWYYAFYQNKLSELPSIDYSSATNIQQAFSSCINLTQIHGTLDFRNATNLSNTYWSSNKLTLPPWSGSTVRTADDAKAGIWTNPND